MHLLMIEYFFTALLILAVSFVYKCIYRPKKIYNFYVRQCQKRGIKVHAIPFKPMRVPILQIIQKDSKQGDALKIAKTVYRDNDIIITNVINNILIDFSSPQFIQDFFSTEHTYTYPKFKPFVAPMVRVMGYGIPFSEGDQWKRKRRIINEVFNFEFLKSKIKTMEHLCSKAIKDIQQSSKLYQENGNFIVQYDVINLTVRMFSSIILQCFLGGAIYQTIQGKPLPIFLNDFLVDVNRQVLDPISFIFGVKFFNLGLRAKDRDINHKLAIFKEWGQKYIKKRITQIQNRIVNQKQASNKAQPFDIIEALIKSRQKTGISHEDYYTDSQIFEEFCTFLVAGTDTTSYFLMTMIYLILKNPQVEHKLRQEIETHMSDDDYSYANLKNMVYIDYIQKQTARVYGPLNNVFLREAKQDNYVNGLPIKKGTLVNIQNLGNCYNQKYYKNPSEFLPERWENSANIPPFVIGGFGGGARSCIGKHLALLQSKIGLVKFMKRYKKIIIPEAPLKFVNKFMYSPEFFTSKLVISKQKNDLTQI